MPFDRPPLPSFGRTIRVLTLQSWRAAHRNHLWRLMVGLVVLVLLGSGFLADFDFGANPQSFLLDFGFGLTYLVTSVLAVLIPAQHWFDLTVGRQAIPLLARPISPVALLLGSFLGSFLALGLVLLALLLLVGGLTAGSATEVAGHFAAIFLQGWLFWCRAGLIAGLVYFFGSYVRSRLLGIVLAGLIAFAGQMSPLANEWAETAPATSAAMVRTALLLVPDLSVFSLRLDVLLAGEVPLVGVAALTGYTLIHLFLYLFLGGLFLRRRSW